MLTLYVPTAIQLELYEPAPSAVTVLVRRSLPPVKVKVAPTTGVPPLFRTCPVIWPAVEINILVGLGSATAFRVELPQRASLSHPVLPAVIARDFRALAGMVKLPLASVTAEPPL